MDMEQFKPDSVSDTNKLLPQDLPPKKPTPSHQQSNQIPKQPTETQPPTPQPSQQPSANQPPNQKPQPIQKPITQPNHLPKLPAPTTQLETQDLPQTSSPKIPQFPQQQTSTSKILVQKNLQEKLEQKGPQNYLIRRKKIQKWVTIISILVFLTIIGYISFWMYSHYNIARGEEIVIEGERENMKFKLPEGFTIWQKNEYFSKFYILVYDPNETKSEDIDKGDRKNTIYVERYISEESKKILGDVEKITKEDVKSYLENNSHLGGNELSTKLIKINNIDAIEQKGKKTELFGSNMQNVFYVFEYYFVAESTVFRASLYNNLDNPKHNLRKFKGLVNSVELVPK